MSNECDNLVEIDSVELWLGVRVQCTRLSFHDTDLSYPQLIELALEIKEQFPVQNYTPYPRSLYLTFSEYLSVDDITKIKRMYEIRVRANTVRNKGRELII